MAFTEVCMANQTTVDATTIEFATDEASPKMGIDTEVAKVVNTSTLPTTSEVPIGLKLIGTCSTEPTTVEVNATVEHGSNETLVEDVNTTLSESRDTHVQELDLT